MTVPLLTSLPSLRQTVAGWRRAGESVALVPTMGALHAGHLELVAQAKQRARRVVVSIFVNPLQFGPTEDFHRYPRPLETDRALLDKAGCDALYAPGVDGMYGDGFVTAIDPGPLGKVLDGAVRPGHFAGVATVVVKLLNQVGPDAALFGEKDYQQLLVIRRVTRDLDLPVEIIGVPIVRDADGLALSSRNVYLSAAERRRAVVLPETLQDVAAHIRDGQAVDAALEAGRARLGDAGFAVDYLVLADIATLQPLTVFTGAGRLLAAAKMGATRLIDNCAVGQSTSL